LLSTIFFWPNYYAPFGSAKLIGFLFFTQLALPFYLAIIAREGNLFSRLHHPAIIALGSLILIMIASSALGIDPINSFFGTLKRPISTIVFLHGFFFVLYLHELFTFNQKWKHNLTTLLIGITATTSAYAIIESWLPFSLISQENRTAGLSGNPIYLASFLILPLFFSLSRAIDTNQKHKTVYWLTSGIIIGAILLSGTRGATLGLIAGFAFFVCVQSYQRGKSHLSILAKSGAGIFSIVLLIWLAGFVLPSDSPIQRLTAYTDNNVQTRLTYWGMALRGSLENPILGSGPGNFYRVADKFFTPNIYSITTVWPDKPHNTLLEWLESTGIVGLAAFVGILFFLFQEGWRKKRSRADLILLAGLTAYVVQSAFVFHTIGELIAFLFFLAWVISSKPETNIVSPPPRQRRTVVAAVIGALVLLIGVSTVTIPFHTLALNIGKGTAAVNQNTNEALAYFEKATSQPIVWDDALVAEKYFDITNQAEQTTNSQATIQAAINVYERTVSRHPLRAKYWTDLARLYVLLADTNDGTVDQAGITAAQRAIDLAPQRFEGAQTMAFILAQNGDLFQAAEYSSQTVIKNARALTKEYLTWAVDLSASRQEFETVIEMYTAWRNAHPEDLSILANLAATYAQNGQIEKAIETANELKRLDPASVNAVDEFLLSL
jgi:O-antigen ligase